MSRRFASLAVLIACCVFLAACSGDASSSTTNSGGNGDQAAGSAETAQPAADVATEDPHADDPMAAVEPISERPADAARPSLLLEIMTQPARDVMQSAGGSGVSLPGLGL